MSPSTTRIRDTHEAGRDHDHQQPAAGPASLIHVDGRIVEVDQSALSLLGFEHRDDVIGLSVLDLVAPESLAAAHFRMQRMSAGQPMKSQVLSFVRADGSEFAVEITSSPTIWNGCRAGRVALVPATTPATQLLHYATGVLSELSDAVIVTDLHGHIRSWNGAAERLYGWTADEVIGQRTIDVVPWADQQDHTAPSETLFEEERWHGEGRHIRRDGSSVGIQSSTTVVRDENDEPIGVVSVNRPLRQLPSPWSRRPTTTQDRADMRRGIDHDEFVVHYQPVVHVRDGTIVGVEALARWNHPVRGLLQPHEFIDDAEETGLIVDLGGATLEKACRQTAKWHSEGVDLELAVNLSTKELADAGLVERVRATLARSGLDAKALWLEVTETALVDDIERASDTLRGLAALGVRISIDDFGTGWASLTYLRHFPVHALKIDRVFVAGITDNPSDTAIIKSVISLGHELGLAVIAEGIETVKQQQALIGLGCTTGQGFLFGRPVPPECLVLSEPEPPPTGGANVVRRSLSLLPPSVQAASASTPDRDHPATAPGVKACSARPNGVSNRPDMFSRIDDAERWRLVEVSAQAGVWMLDADNRTTYLNRVVTEMLGYESGPVAGSPIFEVMDAESSWLSDAIQNHQHGASEVKFQLPHRDGSTVWVSLRATPVIAADGAYLGALATLIDVSRLHDAQQDLDLTRQTTMSIASMADVGAAGLQVLSSVADVGGRWDRAEVWVTDVAGRCLTPELTWVRPNGGASGGSTLDRPLGAQCAETLPSTRTSQWIEDWIEPGTDGDAGSGSTLAATQYASALAVPVELGHSVLAVLVLFATRRRPRCDQELHRIEALSSLLGLVVERRRSEDRRAESESRLREFIDHMPAMVYMTDSDGHFLLTNRTAETQWLDQPGDGGRDASELGPELQAGLSEDLRSYRENVAMVLATGTDGTFKERGIRHDGVHWYSTVRFPVLNAAGDVYGVGGISTDITDRIRVESELAEAHRQLERRALHDSLTELPNRAHLVERLALLDSERLAEAALIFVDLDDFKDVNDSYGHAVGDELLRVAATRIRSCIRPQDLVARLGGDEFAVLLERASAAQAEALARRIVTTMDAPFRLDDRVSRVSASVGIASGTACGGEASELLRFADLAMYEAKARGKGRFVLFDPTMDDAARRRADLDAELHRAIESDELCLHYEPIVDLATGRMLGAEALLRWQHPTRGLLGPDEFVPGAVRTGAIIPLGRWVLQTACAQAKVWRDSRAGGRFVMSVNISARQLDEPSFLSMVEETLESTGLPSRVLCLEVTETDVMSDGSGAGRTASALRSLGVRLSVDDFGTGHASLTHLGRLRADAVKIDRSFIEGLGTETEDTMIVTAIVALARVMGLRATAEGVKTAEQVAILRDLGCEFGQGPFISGPAPAEELTRQLERLWLEPAASLSEVASATT